MPLARFTVRFALLIALAVLGLPGCGGGLGTKTQNGQIEVYYKDGVTQDEADKLAAHLAKVWAEAASTRSVQLTKTGGKYQFRMVVKKEYHNDDNMLRQIGIAGARVSRDVLGGAAVEVEACDEQMKTVRAVPVPTPFRHGILKGKVELFYADGVSSEDAGKLLEFVAAEFQNAPAPMITFALEKRDATHIVYMAFNQELLKKPEVVQELKAYREKLAKAVFKGEPVELAMCDDSFNVTETFKP